MKVQYEISMSELKAIVELLQELCHRSGIDESITKSLFKKLNERDFR